MCVGYGWKLNEVNERIRLGEYCTVREVIGRKGSGVQRYRGCRSSLVSGNSAGAFPLRPTFYLKAGNAVKTQLRLKLRTSKIALP